MNTTLSGISFIYFAGAYHSPPIKTGSAATGGFAPYASRFNNGGYIHGVPTNAPATGIIEYSYTLGTIPRSHMCVRNATSHAKFIFEWAPVNETIIFVLE